MDVASRPSQRRRGKLEDAGHSTAETPPSASAAAAIVEDQRNRVVIETTNANDAWLVLSDNFYPGWRAMIDSRAAEIFQADATMRAVKVPAGRHVVSFVFAPEVFRASLMVSLAAAALLGLGLVVAAVRRRRE